MSQGARDCQQTARNPTDTFVLPVWSLERQGTHLCCLSPGLWYFAVAALGGAFRSGSQRLRVGEARAQFNPPA